MIVIAIIVEFVMEITLKGPVMLLKWVVVVLEFHAIQNRAKCTTPLITLNWYTSI